MWGCCCRSIRVIASPDRRSRDCCEDSRSLSPGRHLWRSCLPWGAGSCFSPCRCGAPCRCRGDNVCGKLTAIGLLVTWLILGSEVSVASADGGAVRYSERHDDRLITVFTDPTPLRAGIVDVSVLIQDANS